MSWLARTTCILDGELAAGWRIAYGTCTPRLGTGGSTTIWKRFLQRAPENMKKVCDQTDLIRMQGMRSWIEVQNKQPKDIAA